MHDFRPARELLPATIHDNLPPGARRLFGAIWNRMHFLRVIELASVDADMARRAGVPLEHLPHLQKKLVEHGLLDIKQDERPGFAPEARRSVYLWLEVEALTA